MSEVSPILPADVPAIADFLAAFPGDKFSTDQWLARLRAWWDLNPAFTEGVTARGWLLRDREGKLAGLFGNIPLLFMQAHRETIVHAGTTWRVLAGHRGLSMALKRRQMLEHRAALHFSTTPAPQVVKILRLLGYQLISQWQGGGQQSVVVLNFRPLLAEKLKALPCTCALTALAAPLAALWQSLRLRRLHASPRFKTRELIHADEAFDDLWSRTKARYANTNVRSAAVLNWFCFTVPIGQKKLLGCYEGSCLLGYLVLLVEPETTRLTARCLDLWIDPDTNTDAVLSALLLQAQKTAAAAHCDLLILPHFHEDLATAYRRLGLFPRPAWPAKAYLAAPPEALSQMLPVNTYLVEAQGDLGL